MSTMIGRERSLQKAFEPILEDYDFICMTRLRVLDC